MTRIGKKSLYRVDTPDLTIWKSYSTIIAICVRSKNTLLMTSNKYSVTTSKHCSIVRQYYLGINTEFLSEKELQDVANNGVV